MLTVITWLLVIGHGAVFAQDTPPGNAGVIAGLLAPRIMDTIEDNYQYGDTLAIVADEAPMSQWLSRILTDSCVAKNYFVYSYPEVGDNGWLQLHLNDAASRIHYESDGRKWLLFSRPLRRTVTASAHIRLSRRGHVIASRIEEGTHQDGLLQSWIDKVENPELSFTRGTKKQNPYIKRWVEPVILSAATATVIYLFYTLRSSN